MLKERHETGAYPSGFPTHKERKEMLNFRFDDILNGISVSRGADPIDFKSLKQDIFPLRNCDKTSHVDALR